MKKCALSLAVSGLIAGCARPPVKSGMKLPGVAGEQVETVGRGGAKPRAAGHDEAAWTANRRSDIVYAEAQ